MRVPGTIWTLPGGDALAGVAVSDAARNALAEQTAVASPSVEQLFTFDDPEVRRVIVAYLALVPPDQHAMVPGGEAVELRWYPVADLPALDPPDDAILDAGLERLRAKAIYSSAPLAMLATTFTLSEAQKVYEQVLGRSLDPRNFRRDIVASGAVEPAGRSRASGPGRPAQLYRHGEGEFAVEARERRAVRRLSTPLGGGGDERQEGP